MYLFIYIVNITLGARGLFTQLFIYKIIYEFTLNLFYYSFYLLVLYKFITFTCICYFYHLFYQFHQDL